MVVYAMMFNFTTSKGSKILLEVIIDSDKEKFTINIVKENQKNFKSLVKE